MTYVIFATLIVAAYLFGSIPFGLIIARIHGKDLRCIGSGNIGATNVSRALGRKWASVCFLLDVLKGMAPTLAAKPLTQPLPDMLDAEKIILLWLWLAVGCAAILGHIFPIYLKFKGGKGVATSLGVVLGLWPYYTICAPVPVAVWAVLVLVWHYVSLASISAAISFPICLTLVITFIPQWNLAELWPLVIAAIAVPALVIIRHRSNIKRLLAGTESKVLKRDPDK